MIREIKFRFFDGDKMHYPEDNYAYSLRWLRTTGWALWWIWDNLEKPIWEQFGINSKYNMMEFTGLKDKKNREIYEGDIIRVDWNDTRYKPCFCTVTWDNENALFLFGAGATGEVCWSQEVIGTIYENPELLK